MKYIGLNLSRIKVLTFGTDLQLPSEGLINRWIVSTFIWMAFLFCLLRKPNVLFYIWTHAVSRFMESYTNFPWINHHPRVCVILSFVLHV